MAPGKPRTGEKSGLRAAKLGEGAFGERRAMVPGKPKPPGGRASATPKRGGGGGRAPGKTGSVEESVLGDAKNGAGALGERRIMGNRELRDEGCQKG